MKTYLEKQFGQWVLIKESDHDTVDIGAPHMKGALSFTNKSEAKKMQELLDVDSMLTKDKWTEKHWALYNSIPEIVRNVAGDLFEIKWYGHNDYEGMLWEVEHNLLGKPYLTAFKDAYDSLTDSHKNLIYYAYEA